MIDVGTDFSGVGAIDQALIRLGIKQNKIFACDNDKYARDTYVLNFGEPKYFPNDVYERKIPKKSLGLYVTTPPCQGFSMAGLRNGSILFLNSHEFIQKNKPRYFIFENVEGLLSHEKKNVKDEYGTTFSQWINYLGGKSVNGNTTIFPDEKSVPYHIYYKVINARHIGVPQNRKRVFIVGIRDDADNKFSWPIKVPLIKSLKDIIEEKVDEKYFLSGKMIDYLQRNQSGRALPFTDVETKKYSNCILADYHKTPTDGMYIKVYDKIRKAVKNNDPVILSNIYGGFNEDQPRLFEDYSPTIRTAKGGGHIPSVISDYRIRKMTPLECFRLMDFNEDFKWNVSDTRAYIQAGNSVVVKCYEEIIKKLIK